MTFCDACMNSSVLVSYNTIGTQHFILIANAIKTFRINYGTNNLYEKILALLFLSSVFLHSVHDYGTHKCIFLSNLLNIILEMLFVRSRTEVHK